MTEKSARNVTLHGEVVRGIIRCVRFVHRRHKMGASIGLSELFPAARGREGYRHDNAETYVAEFIKDGMPSLEKKHIDAVMAGDYGWIWASVNAYLQRCHRDPVEPYPVFFLQYPRPEMAVRAFFDLIQHHAPKPSGGVSGGGGGRRPYMSRLLAKPRHSLDGLTPEELEVLVNLLRSAGFLVNGLKPGKDTFFYGKPNRSPAVVEVENRICPYVIGGPRNSQPALGWLCEQVYRVQKILLDGGELDENALKNVCLDVRVARLLRPIQLTADGDLLIESQLDWVPPDNHHASFFPGRGLSFPGDGYIGVTHKRDRNRLSSTLGEHRYCGGQIFFGQTTKTSCVVHCRMCGLRFMVPRTLKTYGELRKFCRSKILPARS